MSSCVIAVEPIFGPVMRTCHGLVFTYLCLVGSYIIAGF